MKRGRMLVCAVLLACSFTAQAQWTQTAGPEGAVASGIVAEGGRIIAVVGDQVHHLETGVWSQIGSLQQFDGARAPMGGSILLRDGSRLLANTRSGIVISSDNGATWSAAGREGVLFRLGERASVMSDGAIYQLENGTTWRQVATLPELSSIPVLFNGAIYTTEGYESGLRRSTDNGVTWEELPTNGAIIGSGSILASGSDAMYAAGGRSIYRSVDGVDWSDISHDLPEWLVIERIIPGSELMITTNMGFRRLAGSTWEKIDLAPVTAVATLDNGAILATRAGIFQVRDDSRSAVSLNRGLIAGNAGMLGTIGDAVFANTPNGIYRSVDKGENWTQVSDFTGYGFARDGDVLYTISGITYRSSDSGASWQPAGPTFDFEWEGPPQRNDVTSIAAADGAVYIGVATYLTDKGSNGAWASGGIFRSTDNGATWQEKNSGLPHGAGGVPAPITSIAATREYVVISTAAGIYRSTDRGDRWTYSMAGLPAPGRYTPTGELTVAGSTIYLRMADGFYESLDGGISWRRLSNPLPEGFRWYSSLSVVDDRIYLRGYRDDGAGGFDERLFLQQSSGWLDITASQPAGVLIESIVRAGQFLYAGTRRDGVWTMPVEGALPSSVHARGLVAATALSIRPNPSLGEMTVEYTLATRGELRLSLLNMLGEEVMAIDRGMSEAGEQSIVIDTRNVPAGLYLLRATVGSEVFEGRIVVAK